MNINIEFTEEDLKPFSLDQLIHLFYKEEKNQGRTFQEIVNLGLYGTFNYVFLCSREKNIVWEHVKDNEKTEVTQDDLDNDVQNAFKIHLAKALSEFYFNENLKRAALEEIEDRLYL